MNIAKFLRTPILKNGFEGLLLPDSDYCDRKTLWLLLALIFYFCCQCRTPNEQKHLVSLGLQGALSSKREELLKFASLTNETTLVKKLHVMIVTETLITIKA